MASLPRVLGQEAEPLLRRILADPDAAVADRQAAIAAVNEDSSDEALIAIAGTLSDQRLIKRRQQRDYEVLTRPSTPFEGYPLLPLKVAALKKWLEEKGETPRTISDLAQERLRALTKHNFGKDATAWRRWIEANWPASPSETRIEGRSTVRGELDGPADVPALSRVDSDPDPPVLLAHELDGDTCAGILVGHR
jgi:hypothetical protein